MLPTGGDEEDLVDVPGGQPAAQHLDRSASHTGPLVFRSHSHLRQLETIPRMEILDVADEEADALPAPNRSQTNGARSRQDLPQPQTRNCRGPGPVPGLGGKRRHQRIGARVEVSIGIDLEDFAVVHTDRLRPRCRLALRQRVEPALNRTGRGTAKNARLQRADFTADDRYADPGCRHRARQG